MEILSFINDLRKKGKSYQEVWMPLIYQFEPLAVKEIKISVPMTMARSYFYTILNYGLENFPKHVSDYKLSKNKNNIVIYCLSEKNIKAYQKKQLIIALEKQESKEQKRQARALKKQVKKPVEEIEVVEPIIVETVLHTIPDSKEIIPEQIVTPLISFPIAEKRKRVIKPKYPDEIYIEIVNYLNECSGHGYNPKTRATQKLITDRLDEGFTIADFKKVILTKANEWLGNVDYERYLRPATLFKEDKFESYLNQKAISKKPKQQTAYDNVSKATELGWADNSR